MWFASTPRSCSRWNYLAAVLAPLWACRAQADEAYPAHDSSPRLGPLEAEQAGSAATDPPGYAEAITAGLSEYDLGHYQEARVHFATAHQLAPSARTLRALGNVDFELRNYGDCVTHLSAALGSRVKPLSDKIRLDTQRLLDRAKVYVGEVHVNVEPGSATVSVDGVTMARGPVASLALLVGDHVLEFRAQGHLSERRSIQVKAGETTLVEVVLSHPVEAVVATGSRAPPLAPPPAQRDVPKSLHKQWWLWTSVGVAVAAVAVGVGVGVTQANRSDDKTVPVSAGTIGTVLRAP